MSAMSTVAVLPTPRLPDTSTVPPVPLTKKLFSASTWSSRPAKCPALNSPSRWLRKNGRSAQPGAGAYFAPLLVAQTSADLGHGLEHVGFLVVHAYEQCADAQADTFAAATEVAKQHAIDGVVEGAARVALEFDPVEVSCPGLI